MRRVPAATGRLPASLYWGKSLQPFFRVGKLTLWSRSRGPRRRPSGKDRLPQGPGDEQPPGPAAGGILGRAANTSLVSARPGGRTPVTALPAAAPELPVRHHRAAAGGPGAGRHPPHHAQAGGWQRRLGEPLPGATLGAHRAARAARRGLLQGLAEGCALQRSLRSSRMRREGAPWDAVLNPWRSQEELGGTFLGHRVYLTAKARGEKSMPEKRGPLEDAKGAAPQGPRDRAKAGLPEPQSPAVEMHTRRYGVCNAALPGAGRSRFAVRHLRLARR